MSKIDKPPVTSAVANQPKVAAARRQAQLDQLTTGTQNNTNPGAGGGGGKGAGGGGGATGQQTPGHSQTSTFTPDADDATKATTKPDPANKTKPGVKRDLTGKARKVGAGAAGSGTTTTTGGKPRSVQRPKLTPTNKASVAGFGQSSKNMLTQFHRARGTFRAGVKRLVKSFSLKAVLRGLARKAPQYLFRVFGVALNVVLYALDSSEVAAGGFPAWYERYRSALWEYLRLDDPAAKMNALRKMNVAVYVQQEKDSRAFIAVMTGLGEVLNQDESKRAAVMRQYQELIRNYKKSLRAAGTLIAKTTKEGERLYAETKVAYGWNQAYMQHLNSYHYPYVKKFKKVSEQYLNLANRLRDDAVAASADLH